MKYCPVSGKGLKAAHGHIGYIKRDGVARDGSSGHLYSAELDLASGQEFIERSKHDIRQFRLMIAPEDSDLFDDLKPLIRKLMAQMETDLGTQLDWVASDHFNTGHFHTHIVIRGVEDTGDELYIAKDYMSQGVRARAEDLVMRDLGPKSVFDITERARAEYRALGLTSLDREFLDEASESGHIRAYHPELAKQALRAARLQKLRSLGLAEDAGRGQWSLSSELTSTLTTLSKRRDVHSILQAALEHHDLPVAVRDCPILDPSLSPGFGTKTLCGKVLEYGFCEDSYGEAYLVIDASDGRVHYVGLKKEGLELTPKPDLLVEISFAPPDISAGVSSLDVTIFGIAKSNDGRYDAKSHLAFCPGESEDCVNRHLERLFDMHKTMGKPDLLPHSGFHIGETFLDIASTYESKVAIEAGLTLKVCSPLTLETQVHHAGITWLDRQLLIADTLELSGSRFGRALGEALAQRLEWQVERGLAERLLDGRTLIGPRLLTHLKNMEYMDVASTLEKEVGLPLNIAQPGERLEGRQLGRIKVAEETFSVIERAHSLYLVPWQEGMLNTRDLEISPGPNRSHIERSRSRELDLGLSYDLDFD